MAGRKPKPTQLRVLEGMKGHRPLNKNEVKPKEVAPECPSWLNEYAQEEWQSISKELLELGLLTNIDGTALAGYCQAVARWRQAEEFLEKYSKDKDGKCNGFMVKAPSGYLQQLPQVSIAQKYLQIAKSFLIEFGLTPSSRANLIKPEPKREKSEFEKKFGNV
jgi:P27 family predicted phage terminase small subunit